MHIFYQGEKAHRWAIFCWKYRVSVLKLEYMNKTFSETEMKTHKSLQGILWSKDIRKLDLKKDKVYIIHQVLSFGNLNQIRWLFKAYDLREIREVFLKDPKKVYTIPIFYFIKNFILGLKKKNLSKEKYVKTSLRALK